MVESKKSNGGGSNDVLAPSTVGGENDESSFHAQISRMMAAELHGLAPHLNETQCSLLVDVVLKEQSIIANTVYRDVLDPERQKQYPYWGMKIEDITGGKGEIAALKKPSLCKGNLVEILRFAELYAFVQTPILRMLLRAYGFKYQFIQAPEPAPKVTLHRR